MGDEIEILTPPDEMAANIIEPRTGVEEAEETDKRKIPARRKPC